MSKKIKLLDNSAINKIAAGEVIENPSSVIKELVENSIDANASHINIETFGAGFGKIIIKDNGDGILEEDIPLFFVRHATSKIRSFEDLSNLHSFGFRGEAIASIASVSKLTLHTATEGAFGKKIIFNKQIISNELSPRTKGTSIEVSSLFYNVPARKNFQKSNTAENLAILKALTKILLINTNIGFEWHSESNLSLSVNPNDDLLTRIKLLLGEEFGNQLLEVNAEESNLKLFGYVGSVHYYKNNRNGQFLFINGRPIYSHVISKAIKDSYSVRLPQQKHPVFVLNLTIPPAFVDFNVHPQKLEARFRYENSIIGFIIKSIDKAISTSFSPCFDSFNLAVETVEVNEKNQYIPDLPSDYMELKNQPLQMQSSLKTKENINNQTSYNQDNYLVYPPAIEAEPPSTFQPEESQQNFYKKILANNLINIYGNFAIFLEPQGLLLLNINRALSRLNWENIQHSLISKQSQKLLFPLSMTFNSSETNSIKENLTRFQELGFKVEISNKDSLFIYEIPCFCSMESVEEFVLFILKNIDCKTNKELLLANSISNNYNHKSKNLSHVEVLSLVKQLQNKQAFDTSPSGKPLFKLLSDEDLNKLIN